MFKLLTFGKPTGNLFRASLVAGLLLSTLTIASAAVTTNFFANFEASSGYTAGAGLDGQNGWTGLAFDTNFTYSIRAGSNGNGVISPGLGGSGQAASVGLTPMPPGYNGLLDLWTNFPFDPVANGQPIVKFSAKVKINDSSNGNYDYFFFNPYNMSGDGLFLVVFDIYNFAVYGVDQTNGVSSTYAPFQPGVEYSLTVTMNFASNTYSASLTNLSTMTGTNFLNSLPITVLGSQLTLASVDAIWQPYDPVNPGDNQMIFDDYLVTSEAQTLPPPPSPTIGVLAYTPGSAATVRLTGQNGYNYAVDYSTSLGTGWVPLATNTVSGTYVDFPDPGAASSSSRFYRGRWVP
jgi:hypothetical protein